MPISVMLKPASGNCNLRCKYCFYHDLAATRQTENKGYMTRDTALQVMDKALAFAGDGPVYFTFQGGEPLLAGKDFFRFFFSSCKERQRPGVTVQFCVQTNGTLLDDEWCDLFWNTAVWWACLWTVTGRATVTGCTRTDAAPLMMCFAVCSC